MSSTMAALVPQELEGDRSVGSRDDAIAVVLQRTNDHPANARVIFHNEDGFSWQHLTGRRATGRKGVAALLIGHEHRWYEGCRDGHIPPVARVSRA
jgi:hypothetical protein